MTEQKKETKQEETEKKTIREKATEVSAKCKDAVKKNAPKVLKTIGTILVSAAVGFAVGIFMPRNANAILGEEPCDEEQVMTEHPEDE